MGQVAFNASEDRKGLIIERTITLPLPFQKWAWLQSDLIPNTTETRTSLNAEYLRIWKALQSKNVGAIMPLFTERNQELAAAFYRTEHDMAEEIGLKDAVSDTNYELIEPEPEDDLLEIMGNGRLARITRWNGKPEIVFNHKDGSGASYFDIVFRKSGGRWIITR